jgi:hypothetical protein
MRMRKIGVAILAALALGVVVIVGSYSQLSKCQYEESAPAVSPDGAYSYQMEFTLCDDHSKSRPSLVMKRVGSSDKVVILDLASSIGTVDVSWVDGPELRVVIQESSIVKRYGPYHDFPRVEIVSP